MKYVGEVTDDSWWKAIEENNILDCIEQMKRDAFERAIKKYGWTR